MTKPTYAMLASLLTELGFIRHETPGVRVVFKYPASKYLFVLRANGDDETVELVGLHVVRTQLDAWGFLSKDEFDDRMHTHSLMQDARPPHAKFTVLVRVLTDLGFTQRTKAGEFTRFDHAPTETWFLYRDYAPDEDVWPPNIVATRYLLDARGIMTREEFNERIRQLSLVG